MKVAAPPALDTYSSVAVYPEAQRRVRPRWEAMVAVALLVIAVGTNRFGIEAGGLNFRLELVIGGALALWCLFRGGLASFRNAGVPELCLLGWLAIGFTSSLLFSPAPQQSLKSTVLVAGFVMLYAVGFMLFRGLAAIQWAAVAWVLVGALVAAIGVVQAMLLAAFGWTNDLNLEVNYQDGVFTATPKVHSTLWEPNIYGSFCLAVGFLALGLSLAPAFRAPRWQWLLRASVVLAFSGVMLSMTRTVWLVAPFLLLLMSLALLLLRLVDWRRLVVLIAPALVGIALGVGIGLTMPTMSIPPSSVGDGQQVRIAFETALANSRLIKSNSETGDSAVAERVTGLATPGEVPSFVGRGRIFDLAFRGWLARPLLGWGTNAFAFYDTGGDKWIPNLELHVLFDTGALGLLLLAVAAGVPLWRGLRTLRRPPERWDTIHFVLFGVMLAGTGLLLAYQTTDGSWLGFTWVFFALLVAAARHAQVAAPATVAEYRNSTGNGVGSPPPPSR